MTSLCTVLIVALDSTPHCQQRFWSSKYLKALHLVHFVMFQYVNTLETLIYYKVLPNFVVVYVYNAYLDSYLLTFIVNAVCDPLPDLLVTHLVCPLT